MHAYLIIAHNQFELLNKLLLALDDPENDIYLHIDKKAGDIVIDDITVGVKHSKVFFVDRKDVVWGHSSQIGCELELFTEAVKQKKYQYLHLISGVDFPLKSQAEIHDFFEKHNGKEFIHFEAREIPEEEKEKIQCYFFLQKYVGRKKKNESYLYCVQRFTIKLQKLLHMDRRRNGKVKFYKGANWVSITGDLAEYIVQNQKAIRKLFRYSMACDEFFVQTVIMNSKFKDNLYDNTFSDDYAACMRYIDWERGGPYVFRSADFEELMNSELLFARKFDWNEDKNIVLKILEEVRS